MTKEQEEAIKMIEIIVDECKLENKRKGYEGTYYDGDTPIPYKEYEIILNMLKAKDKEIQFQKDINKTEKDRHKQAEKSMKGQIEKKDKMIDLMAEWISERCLYIDNYGNSCEIIQDSCNKRNNCKDCIKQYFERIATNDG